MPENKLFDPDYAWECMSDMERSVWATTFALHISPSETGIAEADKAVERLRSVSDHLKARPEPEYEAGMAGAHIEREQFTIWYRVSMLFRHGKDRDYRPPTNKQCIEAYDRFQLSRNDFY